MMNALRATKPGNLLSVAPCRSFGMRAQVEFRGKVKTTWATKEIAATPHAVALVDHTGKIVAKSSSWPG